MYPLKDTKCKICNQELLSIKKLSWHIRYQHKLIAKQYYDSFVIPPLKGCKFCQEETPFIGLYFGYRTFCKKESCKKLFDLERAKIRNQTYKNKTGYDSPAQDPIIIKKKKETCLKLFGTETPLHSDLIHAKSRITLEKKYGIKNISQLQSIKDKKQKTLESHFTGGQDNLVLKEKIKAVNIEKYGVENVMFKKEFVDKAHQNQWSNYKRGYFNSTKNNNTFFYRSSYELIALEKLELNPLVKAYDSPLFWIEYLNPEDNKIHKYYPDFLIEYTNGEKVLTEVKTEYESKRPVVQAKSYAAKQYCQEHNITRFECWTEKELGLREYATII
jgi:hypothetical protein